MESGHGRFTSYSPAVSPVQLRTPAYVVAVQALGPGDVFGWSALLEEHDTLFEVRAREATTALRLGAPI